MIKISERILLALIIVTFLLPAPFTLWIHSGKPSPRFDWIANRTLYGVTVEKKIPPASLASWKSGELQKGLNTLASENFAGRELLIRVYNQVLYQAFRKSYMYFENIIPGKHGDLFQRDDLLVHGRFTRPIPEGEAEALVAMMKYLSERLKKLGSCFVFVITPEKATVYPEDIPDQYLEKTKPGERRPTDYENLVPLLQRYRVPYVDGREITLAHKDTLPVRAFAKTGTHWSRAVAFYTTAALLKMIKQESGREIPELSESIESVDQHPDSTDDDLLKLMNIIKKPRQRYLHPVFQIADNWPGRKGILTFVGGSFVGQMLDALETVFERINYYFYFKVTRRRCPGDIFSSVDENAIPWEEDFWNTRAVALETNEEAFTGGHIRAFLMAELAALDQKMPHKGSVDDPPRPLSWGFGAGENGSALPKKGFGSPEHQLTWITGQNAEVELPSPRANRELQLILEAIPALGEGVSERLVQVEANGIPVGAFGMVISDYRFYSLTIPPAANSAPLLKLHLSFTSPPSPAPGSRQHEIGLARVALVPIGRFAVQEIGER